jgi:hypothetical protein
MFKTFILKPDSPLCRVLLENLILAQPDNKFLYFREPEFVLLFSQERASDLCSEPDESQPATLTDILILSSNLCLDLTSGLFPLGLQTEILYAFLVYSWVLHVPPIQLL